MIDPITIVASMVAGAFVCFTIRASERKEARQQAQQHRVEDLLAQGAIAEIRVHSNEPISLELQLKDGSIEPVHGVLGADALVLSETIREKLPAVRVSIFRNTNQVASFAKVEEPAA